MNRELVNIFNMGKNKGGNSLRSLRRKNYSSKSRLLGGNSNRRNVHLQNFFDITSFGVINQMAYDDTEKALLRTLILYIWIPVFVHIDINVAHLVALIGIILYADFIYSLIQRQQTGVIRTGNLFNHNVFGNNRKISVDKSNLTYIVILFHVLWFFLLAYGYYRIISYLESIKKYITYGKHSGSNDGSDRFNRKSGTAIVSHFISMYISEFLKSPTLNLKAFSDQIEKDFQPILDNMQSLVDGDN